MSTDDVKFVPYINRKEDKVHLGFDLIKDWQVNADKVDQIDFEKQFSWLAAVFAQSFLDWALDSPESRIQPEDRRQKEDNDGSKSDPKPTN